MSEQVKTLREFEATLQKEVTKHQSVGYAFAFLGVLSALLLDPALPICWLGLALNLFVTWFNLRLSLNYLEARERITALISLLEEGGH
jgi:hypothetical protein